MRLMEQQAESGSAEQKIYGKGIGGTDIAFERDTVGLAVIFDKWNDYLHMGGSGYMHILRLDPDVDDVEYTVTQDVQRDIDATLKAILGDVNTMSAITNAVIEELKENGMPTATTGALTTLPTGYRSVDYTYESVDELGKPIVMLYHGKGDNIVNYANSEAVMQAFPDKADLISPQSDDDHIGTTLQWFMTILFNMWRIIY